MKAKNRENNIFLETCHEKNSMGGGLRLRILKYFEWNTTLSRAVGNAIKVNFMANELIWIVFLFKLDWAFLIERNNQ